MLIAKTLFILATLLTSFSWNTHALTNGFNSDCSKQLQQSSSSHFSYLWSGPKTQDYIRRFILDGVLNANKDLAIKVIEVFENVFAAEPELIDREIFKRVKSTLIRYCPSYMKLLTQDNSKRISRRVSQFFKFIDFTPKSYLDMGAGDGKIAEALGTAWNLPKNQIFGTEVASYSNASQNITWVKYQKESRTNLLGDSLDLVSLSMVLHHVSFPAKIIREIHRVLKPGGHLIIRETNAKNEMIYRLNDFLDRLFYAVFSRSQGVTLIIKYKSLLEWKKLFEVNGFEMIKQESVEKGNPFYPFHMLFKKNTVSL